MRDRQRAWEHLGKRQQAPCHLVPPVSRQTTLTRSFFSDLSTLFLLGRLTFPSCHCWASGSLNTLLCTCLGSKIKTNLPVSIPSSIQPVHPCHLAQATRSPPQKPQQESFSRGGVREVCACACACVRVQRVCKSCGAFVLVVKHCVRIHFLSVAFFPLPFFSLPIVSFAIAFFITNTSSSVRLARLQRKVRICPVSLSHIKHIQPSPPFSPHPPWSPQSFDRSASPSPWLS